MEGRLVRSDVPKQDDFAQAGHNRALAPIADIKQKILKQNGLLIIPNFHKIGLFIVNKPILEKYTGNMVNNGFCEICVPIKGYK